MAGGAAILQLLPLSPAETDRFSLLTGRYPEPLARPRGWNLCPDMRQCAARQSGAVAEGTEGAIS